MRELKLESVFVNNMGEKYRPAKLGKMEDKKAYNFSQREYE